MPMASTRPNSDSVLSEKPSASITANVPTSETGTATSGMIDARHVCRNTTTTMTTSRIASNSVCDHRVDRLADEDRRVVDDAVVHARREGLLQPLHRRVHVVGGLERVGAGTLEDADRDGGLVVEEAAQRVAVGAELEARDVATAA